MRLKSPVVVRMKALPEVPLFAVYSTKACSSCALQSTIPPYMKACRDSHCVENGVIYVRVKDWREVQAMLKRTTFMKKKGDKQ